METLIKKYFQDISSLAIERFNQLPLLFKEINEKINIVSRKDIDNIETHHILHSLAIAKFIKFQPSTTIMDLGTGGGLPGIPLAIIFQDCKFHLIDRIGKKIIAAKEIADRLNLTNITFQHGDMGECHEKFDFIVTRGVTDLNSLAKISRKNIKKDSFNALPNGLIALKGGDLTEETKKYKGSCEIVPLSNYFTESFFETKKIIYLPL